MRLKVYFIDEDGLDDKVREQIEKSARHLFGMIHARFVITSRGLVKMVIECLCVYV
jgi:casein kinase II subunit beta